MKSGVTVTFVRVSVLCSLYKSHKGDFSNCNKVTCAPSSETTLFILILFQSDTCFLTPIVLPTQPLQMGSAFKPRDQEADVAMEMPTSQ